MVERAARQSSPEEAGQSTPAPGEAKGWPGVSASTSGGLALDKDVFWFAAQVIVGPPRKTL